MFDFSTTRLQTTANTHYARTVRWALESKPVRKARYEDSLFQKAQVPRKSDHVNPVGTRTTQCAVPARSQSNNLAGGWTRFKPAKSRATHFCNSVTTDVVDVNETTVHLSCLNSRHLSCLRRMHPSCLDNKHLSCLSRRQCHLSYLKVCPEPFGPVVVAKVRKKNISKTPDQPAGGGRYLAFLPLWEGRH